MATISIAFALGSVFTLCACAVAYSALSQIMRTADSFVAVFDSNSARKPAKPVHLSQLS